jgi:hypothetical protein
MTDPDTLARLHDQARRADVDVRRKEHEMEEVEHVLERLLHDFEADEREMEQRIDSAWRRGHPGLERRPPR